MLLSSITMNSFNKKKRLLYRRLSILLFPLLLSTPLPKASAKGLHDKGLHDVPYTFDPNKLEAAEDSFRFFRSFVDLFYLSYKANTNKLPSFAKLAQTRAWCVGDAHPENFGALLLANEKSLFTMNDMDDSGPCPIGLDLFRLLVSTKLFGSSLELHKIVESYIDGIKNAPHPIPEKIKKLLAKSEERGIVPNEKKVKNDKFIRYEDSNEIATHEYSQLQQIIKSYGTTLSPEAHVIDAISTKKIGGGSGGLLRYQVLVNNAGTLLHLEFKELGVPSIYPVSPQQPSANQRISDSVRFTQGQGASKLYRVIQMGSKEMLIRPQFAGNLGVNLSKDDEKSNNDLIRFAAYTLGRIHSLSVRNQITWTQNLNSIPKKNWEEESDLMAEYFEKKYNQLTKKNKK